MGRRDAAGGPREKTKAPRARRRPVMARPRQHADAAARAAAYRQRRQAAGGLDVKIVFDAETATRLRAAADREETSVAEIVRRAVALQVR